MQIAVETNQEILQIQIATFYEQVENFTVNPEERYAFHDSGSHFAHPRFTAALVSLFNIVDVDLLVSSLSACALSVKVNLQQALLNLLKKIELADHARTLAKCIRESENEPEIVASMKLTLDTIIEERYSSIAAFRIFLAQPTKKYVMPFRYCFPVDPSVYDKFFSANQFEDEIHCCKNIKGNLDKIQAFYQRVFTLVPRRSLGLTSSISMQHPAATSSGLLLFSLGKTVTVDSDEKRQILQPALPKEIKISFNL